MSLWYCVPSCRPNDDAFKCLETWSKAGFRVAILRQGSKLGADLEFPTKSYIGYAKSVNFLVQYILRTDSSAQWFAIGGDDYYAIDGDAGKIAMECEDHFGGTFGVMQPTGDRTDNGNIDTSAASAWIGRKFTENVYHGAGPLYQGYHHYYADTELQHIAKLKDCFWQRPDLTQWHDHWTRAKKPTMPSFLRSANKHLTADQQLFDIRRRKKFDL